MTERMCERCTTVLSRWNPRDVCNQCFRPKDVGPDSRRPFWQLAAACMGRDLDIFAPEDDGSMVNAASGPVMAAKVICASCPVRRQCLEWALNREAEVEKQARRAGDDPSQYREEEPGYAGLRHCVFGGFTGAERAELATLPEPVEQGMAAFDRQIDANPVMRLAELVRGGVRVSVPA